MTAFDFSDLPATVSRAGAEPELVQTLSDLVNVAPRALGIKEIIAVASKAGIELPAESTVRTYLNRAKADGRIVKVTRWTYGAAGSAVEEADADVDEEGDDLADV